jgi:heme-binding protein
MKHLRHIVLFAGAALAVMQFLPVKLMRTAPVIPSHTIEANLDVPAPVEAILNNACKNCHSQETRLPWYGKVAPLSWMIASDVERARRAMNLSEWSVQTGARPNVAMGTLLAACAGVEAQRMPPASYRRLHPEARLDQAQVDTLCGWAATEARVLRKQAARKTLALNR